MEEEEEEEAESVKRRRRRRHNLADLQEVEEEGGEGRAGPRTGQLGGGEDAGEAEIREEVSLLSKI